MDEPTVNVTETAPDTTTQIGAADYIKMIDNLKKSTVDVEAYRALQSENKMLADALVQGRPVQQTDDTQPTVDISELADQKNFTDVSNLEYITNALKLRKAVLEQTGDDLFVSKDPMKPANEQAYATASRIADELQSMVDYANGDDAVFLSEYQRRVNDPVIPIGNKRK